MHSQVVVTEKETLAEKDLLLKDYEAQIPNVKKRRVDLSPIDGFKPTYRQLLIHFFQMGAGCLRRISFTQIFLALLPSFLIRSSLAERKRGLNPRKSSGGSIAALDGLRGISCLMVMNMHWAFAITDTYDGGSEKTNTQWLFHRPFFQILWAGTSHVNIFFVLSGYVLSIKCLKLIHAKSSLAVYQAITSSVFRRFIRIFLPPIGLLGIYFVAIRLYVFDYSQAVYSENKNHHAWQIRLFEPPPLIYETTLDQFRDIILAIIKLIDPYTNYALANYKDYDSHLWTIATEFYCSLALYIVLLGTSRLRSNIRLCIHTVLLSYCLLSDHQQLGLFITGMTIAELDLISSLKSRKDFLKQTSWNPFSSAFSHPTTNTMDTSTSTAPSLLRPYLTSSNLLHHLLPFLTGLYLLSIPLLHAPSTPYYSTLISSLPFPYMSPSNRVDLLRSLGAILVVWPISRISTSTIPNTTTTTKTSSSQHLTQLLLTNRPITYLGKISFSLYLCHGFVIRSLGYSLLPHLYRLVIPSTERRTQLSDIMSDDLRNAWLSRLSSPLSNHGPFSLPSSSSPSSSYNSNSNANLGLGLGLGSSLNFNPLGTTTTKNEVILKSQEHLTSLEISTLWILGYIPVVIATIWVSDLFYRYVDSKAVAFAKSIEGKVFFVSGDDDDDDDDNNDEEEQKEENEKYGYDEYVFEVDDDDDSREEEGLSSRENGNRSRSRRSRWWSTRGRKRHRSVKSC